MTKISALEELTPEEVELHMTDDSWGDVVETLLNDLMEISDTLSIKRAYALNSMFVQTSYMGMLFSGLQADSQRIYELATNLRDELSKVDAKNPSVVEWDEIVELAHKNLETKF